MRLFLIDPFYLSKIHFKETLQIIVYRTSFDQIIFLEIVYLLTFLRLCQMAWPFSCAVGEAMSVHMPDFIWPESHYQLALVNRTVPTTTS